MFRMRRADDRKSGRESAGHNNRLVSLLVSRCPACRIVTVLRIGRRRGWRGPGTEFART